MADRSEEGLLAEKVKKKRYGGKSCVAYGCNLYYGERSKQRGITFHAFPWSKPDIARKWERAMHRKAFKATIHSVVCSNHFTPDCFDRTGSRVQLKAGSVPTIFDLPGHPVNRVQHQNPPTEGLVCGLIAPEAFKPTTSLSVEPSYSPVLEPSQKCLRNGSLADGTNTMSAASEGIGINNVTIPPQRFRVCNWHNYSLPSPKVLKQHLSTMESALIQYKHKVKILMQKNRRLQLKVESLQQLLSQGH